MHKYMVNNQPFLFVCDRRTAEMANNQIKVAITKPQDRGKSGLSKKAAESTRSHNRHRELKGNGGFLSLVCSFSLLPESEKEKRSCACGLVGGATLGIMLVSGKFARTVCGSAGRRIVAGSASLVMGCLM